MQNETDQQPLGFIGWMKVVFQTRAATIRQHDATMRAMFESMQRERNPEVENDVAYNTLVKVRGQLGEAQRQLKALADHTVVCHDALELAEDNMVTAGWDYDANFVNHKPALDAVRAARAGGRVPL